MYAKIIIDITHEKLDRTFEYEVPKDMEDGLAIGSSVLVPFGNQDRLRQGFVVGFAKECSFDPEKIKAAGHPTTTMLIVTGEGSAKNIQMKPGQTAEAGKTTVISFE